MAWEHLPQQLPPAPTGFIYIPLVGMPAHQISALQAVYQLALEQVLAEQQEESKRSKAEPHWN